MLLLKALLLRINEAINNIPKSDDDSESLKDALGDKRREIMQCLYKVEVEDIGAMLKDESKLKNVKIIENKSINELNCKEIVKIIEAGSFDDAEKAVTHNSRKHGDNKYTNYFQNFKYFYDESENLKGKLNKFVETLLKGCKIIEIRSWQEQQAIMMFNSLNSKGMPLTDADTISAKLYDKSTKNGEFEATWKEIKLLSDELSKKNIVDLDGALQQFMYINRSIVKPEDKGEEKNLTTTPGVRRYFLEINKYLLENPTEFAGNIIKILDRWNNVKDFPELKLLLKFNVNSRLFLSSFMYRFDDPKKITPDDIMEIVKCFLRLFTLLEAGEAGYSGSKFKSFLFKENFKLVNKEVPVTEIKADFDEQIKKEWKREDVENGLSDYNKNMLVYLNEYLYAIEKNKDFDFGDDVNIEHIMPPSGKNINSIRENEGMSNKEEFDEVVNKLGNKILLEANINKTISDTWFQTKKGNSINEKQGYKDSKFGIAQDLVNYPSDTWHKDDIEKATEKAINRILKFVFGE